MGFNAGEPSKEAIKGRGDLVGDVEERIGYCEDRCDGTTQNEGGGLDNSEGTSEHLTLINISETTTTLYI